MTGSGRLASNLAWPALLVLLTLCAYLPGLGGGYTFDDYPNIVDNQAVHVDTLDRHAWAAAALASPVADLPRPLAMLSFAANHYFTGIDPWPMKATNLAIHLANSLLVLLLARRLLALAAPGAGRRGEWAARFAAGAWALHPINLMAVLFVVQRMESLGHLFVFAGLLLYIAGRARQLARGGGWAWLAAGLAGCTVLGIMAKESAALLPLYALCLEACVFRFRGRDGRRDRRFVVFYGALLVLPAVAGIAWLLPGALSPAAFAHRDFTLAERLLTEPRVVLDYLRWTLLPDLGQLSLYHDDYPASRGLLQPPATLTGLLGVPLLLGLAAWLRTRRPLMSLGLLWFLAAQAMTGTFLPLELVFEHRNYFASLGICIALADALLLAPRVDATGRIGALLAVVFLLACAATTHLRASEWSDELRFATSEAAKHPRSPRATYDQARILVILTGYRADSPLMERTWRALEQARNAPRSGILAHSASLLLAARSGVPADPNWWEQVHARLRQGPVGTQELEALASLTRCARDGSCDFPRDAMLESFLAALEHGPHPNLLAMYGDYALNVLHDGPLALRLWREAVAQRPAEAQYRINLVKLLIAMGWHDEARQEIAKLRAYGRYGQNEASARDLEARLRGARQTAAPGAPAMGKLH